MKRILTVYDFDSFHRYETARDEFDALSIRDFLSPDAILPLSIAPILQDTCPNCKTPIMTVLQTHSISHFYPENRVAQYVCRSCGFWHQWVRVCYFGQTLDKEILIIACLKKFDLSDKLTPLGHVKNWLKKHPEDVYFINPRRFEEVVRDILNEHFDCSFVMTAQSSDGGYDLHCYDIESGSILVEVKRYKAENKIGVKFVRHLAGMLVRQNARHGIIVSTSDFTRNSIKEAAWFSEASQNYPILIDLKKFSDLLPWLKIVPHEVEIGSEDEQSFWRKRLKKHRVYFD